MLSSSFVSNRKDRGAILSFDAIPQGEQLRPLSVTLFIPFPLQDNKFFYGALVKNTVNILYEEKNILFNPERLMAMRLECGYTPEALCTHAGVYLANYIKIEAKLLQPSCREIENLAKALNTTTDYLLGMDMPEELAIPLEDSPGEDFRLRFSRLILETGVTLEALGELTGKKPTTISAWRSGQSKPDADKLLVLARHFGCTTDYLLGLVMSRVHPMPADDSPNAS